MSDAIIMTWSLTRDVVGRSEKQQSRDMDKAQKELDTKLKQERCVSRISGSSLLSA